MSSTFDCRLSNIFAVGLGALILGESGGTKVVDGEPGVGFAFALTGGIPGFFGGSFLSASFFFKAAPSPPFSCGAAAGGGGTGGRPSSNIDGVDVFGFLS